MALPEWADKKHSNNLFLIYGGFNPAWSAGKLEREIVDNVCQLYQLNYPGKKIFASVPNWYDYNDIIYEASKFDPDITLLFSLSDPIGPITDKLQEFKSTVEIIGYSNVENNFIDFWAIACVKFFKKYLDFDLIPNTGFTRTFLNYNRKPHPHRRAFIKSLEQNNLINFGYVTLGESNYTLHETDADYVTYGANDVSGQIKGIPNDIYSLGNLEIWNSCLLNVVSETQYEYNEYNFLSEKIFKPIIGLRPFILNGSPGIYSVLKKAGFDCFDDILPVEKLSNSSREESFPSHNVIIQTIQDLNKENLDTLYQKLLPRLKYNQRLFFEYGKSQESNTAIKSSI